MDIDIQLYQPAGGHAQAHQDGSACARRGGPKMQNEQPAGKAIP